MSTTVRPVTVTALEAVNTASLKGADPGAALLTGSISRMVPSAMTPRKASRRGRVGRTRRLRAGFRGNHFMMRRAPTSHRSSQIAATRGSSAAAVSALTKFIPPRIYMLRVDPGAWHYMDRAALKHLLGRVHTHAIFLLITLGILKLVPRIWQDVKGRDPFDVLSIAGYVVLFWAVYGAAARMSMQGADTPARPLSLRESMQLTTSRLTLGDTLPGGGATRPGLSAVAPRTAMGCDGRPGMHRWW